MSDIDLDTIKVLTGKREKLLIQRNKINEQLKAYELVLGDLASTNPRRENPYTEHLSQQLYLGQSKKGNGNGKKPVIDIVLDYVDGLNGEFTRKQIKQYLKANYPDRQVHENYIYTLLQRLEERNEIEVSRRGKGRRGSLYKRKILNQQMQA